MYSALSCSHFVYARTGLAEDRASTAQRGATCAFCLSSSYVLEPAAVPGGSVTSALPPWQSVHPRCTVSVGYMLALSVSVWHEIDPEVFASTSSSDSSANTGTDGR